MTDSRVKNIFGSFGGVALKPVGNSSVTRVNYSEAVAARITWRGLYIPNYVWLAMVMVAALAISASTALRSREQARNAEISYQQTAERVKQLQFDNQRIRERIKQLRDDPRAAEQAAREQLNYLRPNEVAVKLK
ncbi:MAG: septum formation initiator family protein [Acidobacteriota bacterium]